MHDHSLDGFTHPHVFLGRHHTANERRTLIVVGLTAAMMVAEIAGGAIFGSMALIADGFHMSTHAAALGVAALAYVYARRHANDPRFAFGTGKFGDLAAFASGLALAMVALLIAYESIGRLIQPRAIVYNEALAIAALAFASIWRALGCCAMTTPIITPIITPTPTPMRIRTITTITAMTKATTMAIPTIICARPMFTCWPTRQPRYSPLVACSSPAISA
jgi:hypothetical protein